MILCARNLEFAKMKDEEEIFQTNLERCSYRFLQQTAKAMGLPSNVKKVYLIQLINTKNFCSQRDVEMLVRRIREEQQQLALVRKKTTKTRRKKPSQSPEVSSTSNGASPLISNTPKRVSHVFIRYSPEMYSPTKYSQNMSRKLPITSSDRVLRSSNRVRKQTYVLNTSLMSLLKETEPDDQCDTKVNIVDKEENNRKANRIIAKKIIEGWKNGGARVPAPRSSNMSPPLAKPLRRLSGVYPLQPEDIKLPSVAVRRADGSISKLKAIIQKPLTHHNYNCDKPTDNRNWSLLKEDENAPRPQMAQNSGYRQNMTGMSPNMSDMSTNFPSPPIVSRTSNISQVVCASQITSNLTDVSPSDYGASNSCTEMPQNNFNFNSSSDDTNLSRTSKGNPYEYEEYYHKKIRAEQVRSSRSREMVRPMDSDCQLPKINEVFSKFNSVYSRNITQPLYVNVDSEPDIAPNTLYLPDLSYIPDPRVPYQGGSALEKLYNLRTAHQPVLQIAAAANTRTVYSTPVISTPKAQPSSVAAHNVYNVASVPRDSQSFFTYCDEEMPRAHDFFSNYHHHDQSGNVAPNSDLQRSCTSIMTLTPQEQELGANVTIPEMVEDALEIISQDGDYMERMGMDIRMQCILCNWAGPKIILEYHIRKEHGGEIVECAESLWCARYSLGGLCARRAWRSQLLQHRGALYVLSAKYDDPDYFMATLSTVSFDPDDQKTGSMTIYNKVTGEPFTWTGVVSDLPPCMPYDNDLNCFRLQLSKMDLLPNSANLKLMNRELVVQSPTKVVVGQPELDSIYINVIVKIIDED